MKRISVCLATYNGEKYIKKQVESILNQSREVDEIIISDDGSDDRTLDIIKNINSNKIKIVKNLRKGIINNFENALNYCSGDYIFLADQDDIWMNEKVEKILKLFSEYDLIVHNAEIINEIENKKESTTYFNIRSSGKGFIKNLYKNTYIGCCMAFKREILEDILPFPDDIPMHDSWIGLVSEIKKRKILFLDSVLLYYRRHEKNVTKLKSKNSFYKMLKIRYFLIKNLKKIRRK